MSIDSVAFDSVLDLCRHKYRRIVLGTLAEEQRPVTLNDLTQVVLKHNHQTPSKDASADVLTEIRISLCHCHLPKLAAEGYIDYYSEVQIVEPTKQLNELQPALSTILEADPSLETPIELQCRSTVLSPHSNVECNEIR